MENGLSNQTRPKSAGGTSPPPSLRTVASLACRTDQDASSRGTPQLSKRVRACSRDSGRRVRAGPTDAGQRGPHVTHLDKNEGEFIKTKQFHPSLREVNNCRGGATTRGSHVGFTCISTSLSHFCTVVDHKLLALHPHEISSLLFLGLSTRSALERFMEMLRFYLVRKVRK